MYKLLIFGGTTEGRLLTEFCIQNGICANVSVTTEYGAKLLPQSRYINILNGKLDSSEIAALIKNCGCKIIIDATHPYAKLPAIKHTRNITDFCVKARLIFQVKLLLI